MKPSLQLKLSQHLALTPQLQQSIRLLQLSTLELEQELEKYLLENPLLEREEEEYAPPQTAPGTDESQSSSQEKQEPELVKSKVAKIRSMFIFLLSQNRWQVSAHLSQLMQILLEF